MAFNNDASRNGSIAQQQPNQRQAAPPTGWNELKTQRFTKQPGPRRRTFTYISILLLILVVFTAIRVGALASATNDQLKISVANQQAATVDLRQSFPISPYLLGTNVFPPSQSNSLDKAASGFEKYTSLVTGDMKDMHIKLLRYPGGEWGEQHVLSLDQLSAFSNLLNQTNADGMIQVHLSGPIAGQPQTMTDDVASRAQLAGSWVNYMNNRNSTMRTGAHKNDPFHPVLFWSVGNEPDRLINPATRKPYTVADYANAFIQFSIQMHNNDPSIKVFGPEISQFYGIGQGPFDADHHAWMDDFLKAIGSYEQQHPQLQYHLLDGVSFHRYQFDNALDPSMVLSSSNEWSYIIPQLHSLIKQDLGRDLPVAITEINTNPSNTPLPSRGVAALWWADTLGSLMEQQVSYVAFFSASGVDTPYPLFTADGLHETAMTRIMQLFSHLQSNLVPLSIQHDPISVYATQDNNHQTVSLLFINKSSSVQAAQISQENQFLSLSSWPSVNVSLAGNSMALITLHRNGGAEAYSFIAPTQDDATIGSLTYTVCGQKSDPLANSIPC